MEYQLFLVAVGAAALTALITRAALSRIAARRWIAATLLSGTALPITATVTFWILLNVLPPLEQAGAGMLFALVGLASLVALPLCMLASLAVLVFSRRP